jgi:hypothetical protein
VLWGFGSFGGFAAGPDRPPAAHLLQQECSSLARMLERAAGQDAESEFGEILDETLE